MKSNLSALFLLLLVQPAFAQSSGTSESGPDAEQESPATDEGESDESETPEVASDASAKAREFFAQGRRQMEAGDYKAACASFEESLRFESHVGAMMNLALCHATQKNYATSYSAYLQTAELARKLGDDREAFARGEAAKIESQVQRLRVHISEEDKDAVVRVEGRRILEDEGMKGVPVDPGKYEIQVERPGELRKTFVVDVEPGVEVPVVEISSSEENPSSVGMTTSVADSGPSRSPLPWVGLGVAGVGGVTAIVGGVLYGVGSKTAGDADCRETTIVCTDPGKEDRDRGANQANAGVGLMAVGGAFVVGGVVTYFLTRSSARKETARGVHFDGVAVSPLGAFTSVGGRF